MVVFWILVGWIACAVTAIALGLALFRLLHVSLERLESFCLGYVAGSAVLSCIVFAMAAMGIARKGVFLSMSVLALAASLYFRRWLLPPVAPGGPRVAVAWKILFAVGIIAYGTLYFRQALSPEMSADGMMYHLGLVNLFNRAHGFVRYVDMYTGLPEGIEMLFFYAFAIGKHSAASLVHFSFLVDLALLMALYGRRFGFPSAGVAGALLVFASPLVGADGTCAYNDVGLAAVTFAAVYLLALWRNQKSTGLLMACSIVTGFTMAIKYTSVLFAGFVLVMIVVGLRGQSRRRPKACSTETVDHSSAAVEQAFSPAFGGRRVVLVAAAGLVMSVCVAPYLVRNALWFDNPVAFFGNSVFRNPYFHIAFEQDYARHLAHLNGLEWREMPMELTTGGPHVEGCLGAVFLLAPLALAGVLWPPSRFLVLAALSVMVSFPAARSPRYLIPALPMIAIATAFVLSRISLGVRKHVSVGGILLAALVVADLVTSWPPQLDRRYRNPGWHVGPIPWKVALRKVPEDTWLNAASEEYAITRRMDAAIPTSEPVFSMACPGAKSYTDRDIVIVFQSAHGEVLGDLLYSTWNSPVSGRRRWRFRFPAVNAREVRLVQQGRSAGQQWSINEVGLEWNGTEIPIGPGAHPYAWPNPWDAGLAFDGDGVTRWRTWEPLKPGMHLGVRFDASVRLDGLTVLDFPDEYDGRMSLQVLNDASRWVEEPPPSLEIVPAMDLRKEAMQALKRDGVHFVLLSRRQWNSAAFLDAAGEWGLAPVTGTPSYTLFRIE
jgi:hypothetical protein